MLDDQERELLGRLSVFAGRWTLEAAEAVGAGGPVEAGRVLDLHSMLVDKSLAAEKSGEGEGSYVRYRMLEPVRQFGREKLEESPEAPQVLRRHAEHYLTLAERAEPELMGARQGPGDMRALRTSADLRRGLGSREIPKPDASSRG